jgi:tight adherence protein C
VLTVAASLLGYYAIDLWLYQKAHDRKAAIQLELADSIDLLTISVEAGLGFDAALAHVARNTGGPLSEEFARVLQEMQIGMARSEALRALGERSDVAELRGFTTAMVQADAFGIPVGKVLRVQSQELRVKRRQVAEEKAQKVPVKILFPLIFFILPTLFIVVMGPAVISMLGSFS